MADEFDLHGEGLTSPIEEVRLCTPDDDNDLANRPRAIAFSAAGALRITTEDGTTVTIPSGVLSAGVWHPMRPVRIHSTGTTATDIVYGW